MNSQGWQTATSPYSMLTTVTKVASGRKLQFLVCALARECWDAIPNDIVRAGVIAAERFVDGEISEPEYTSASTAATTELHRELRLFENQLSYYFALTALLSAFSSDLQHGLRSTLRLADVLAQNHETSRSKSSNEIEFRRLACQLFRELLGDPYRVYAKLPDYAGRGVLLPDGVAFQVPETALRIAEAVQADQDYSRLPIIADALEDAGCPDRVWLDHLRGDDAHRRGCWALDLVLGKIESRPKARSRNR